MQDSKQPTLKLINKEHGWDILSRLIDVLHINLFIVDHDGLILLPPEEGKYGSRLLTDPVFGFCGNGEPSHFTKRFEPYGRYLKHTSPLQLHQFAIPMVFERIRGTIGYMMVGPVILDKRLEESDYEALVTKLNIAHPQDILDEIKGLWVISNAMMNIILDLLYEIVKNNLELSGIKIAVSQDRESNNGLTQELKKAAKDLYSAVCLDELLVTLLDAALKMTDTEAGSIMLIDKEKQGSLTVKVYRGLNEEWTKNAEVKIGDRIAGLAAKGKRPFIIHGQRANKRIRRFLKRPEIRHALVMPLMTEQVAFGVLNMHTRKKQCAIEGNIENLQYLSRLLSSVV